MTDRSALFEVKLTGLVRRSNGRQIDIVESPGAAGGLLRVESDDGTVVVEGYLLAEGPTAERMLGPGLLWANKHELGRLTILAESDSAGALARRAGHFDDSVHVEVLEVHGTELTAAAVTSIPDVPTLGSEVWRMAGLINDAGARAVDDHGRLVAEFAGLEVARVVLDPDGEPLLEVGVGQADRELHQLVHGQLDADASLRRAIAAVAVHRRRDANPHPLNRLARERWLRAMVLDDPSVLGLASAEPIAPLRPRDTLLGTQAVAIDGRDHAGNRVIVVCSVGVDVDVAAEAGDYRARTDPSARLLVAMPARDHYPVVQRLIGLVSRSSLVTIPTPWATESAE